MPDKKKEEVTIFSNKERKVAPKEIMTGAELRAFFNVPPENKLYKEVPGKPHPDILIKSEDTVELKNGDKFYDLPPAVVGMNHAPSNRN
jgi:hypothetical protein